MNKKPLSPTVETYDLLQKVYARFNKVLFGGTLPGCLITLQRPSSPHSYGYFHQARFVRREGETTDEIAMNPEWFAGQPISEILSTLAHEMVHLWQAHHGTPGRRGYHNREWAAKMESIGLMPSDTGEPSGKKTGEKVSHYVIEGGPFARIAEKLAIDPAQLWADRYPRHIPEGYELNVDGSLNPLVEGKPSLADMGVTPILPRPDRSNRVKYTCIECGVNAWGKPGLFLFCGCMGTGLYAPMTSGF